MADDAVDAGRFAELTALARTETGARARAALLAEALGLWRGPACADFQDADFVGTTAAGLAEQRITAQEDLAEARLELGEHALLADELAVLIAQHPLRQRLRAAQMRALYGTGRQNEALAAYRDLSQLFAEELGIGPGAELGALHEAILRQVPGAVPPGAAAPAARSGGAVRQGHEPPHPRGRWLLEHARLGFAGSAGGAGVVDDRDAVVLDGLPAVFRGLGDRWGEAAALSSLALRALHRGDLAELRRNAESAARPRRAVEVGISSHSRYETDMLLTLQDPCGTLPARTPHTL
ncbi:BTAD domain-containing putative transcriptional regulator [Streptomyces sp. NPDC085639]|uniref:AfsR/SARP family transcriptional regulator n=1 Tax=Streptomyces sp. NPDC085639 TaxID=3365734 RepID=UPI0037CD7B6C